MNSSLSILQNTKSEATLIFSGELTLYEVSAYETTLQQFNISQLNKIILDLTQVTYIDTAVSLFFHQLFNLLAKKNILFELRIINNDVRSTLELIQKKVALKQDETPLEQKSFLENFGKSVYDNYLGFLSFMIFLGKLFETKLHYLKSLENIRHKEIAFEIYESGIKALWIVALTSFLVGLVVAYQSAYQLKLYGANIFIVDMLGISIFRELAPLITAIVIAGRSGSAFTAQIGAMKITQELDAMKTMGFDPYIFLVMPRIIALMISLPLLIFIADMMGVLGGMVVANLDLKITTELFLDRFNEVIAVKHFFIGLLKGPFFAFLIATIGIYRGLMVKDDTQSIGFNTTKSVVEAIFAVIVCDAVFSIAFTNLGI